MVFGRARQKGERIKTVLFKTVFIGHELQGDKTQLQARYDDLSRNKDIVADDIIFVKADDDGAV